MHIIHSILLGSLELVHDVLETGCRTHVSLDLLYGRYSGCRCDTL
jgi:hypothetical protein